MLQARTEGVLRLLAGTKEAGYERLRRRELIGFRLTRRELSHFRLQNKTQLQVVRYGSRIKRTEGAFQLQIELEGARRRQAEIQESHGLLFKMEGALSMLR